MKNILLFILIVAHSGISIGQSITQNIRGSIVDSEAKFPLIGASGKIITANNMGVIADENGNFKFSDVPVGRHTLTFTYVGYKEVILNNVIVDAGKEVILNIELQESLSELSEVVITARRNGESKNEMAMVSARQFSVDETDRYAGSRGEPARMASNFAGVQGADDSRNDIVIRGNSPSGVLWRLEGVSIPNPNHFAIPGTSGGPVSIINNKYLANSDFFTGAFPAEFGNGTAGVFDLKLRNGNNQQHEFMFQFGFLGTEGMAEGPINKEKGSSYMATFRYANLWLFNKIGVDIGTQAVPQYQDAFVKLNFPQKKGGNLSLWALGGNSTIDILISEQTLDERNIFGASDRDQYYSSAMGVTGITFEKPIDKKTFLKATLALSGNLQDANHDFLILKKDAQGDPVIENNLYAIDQKVPILDYVFKENKLSGILSVNKKFSARSTLKYGINMELSNFNAFDSVRTVSNDIPAQISAWDTRWLTNTYYAQLQPYAQWKYFLDDKWTLNIGATSFYSSINKQSFSPIEPRMGISRDLRKSQKISMALGLHSQMQAPYTYFYAPNYNSGGTQQNRNMGLTKSLHLVASYSKLLGKNMRLLAETYYQNLYNIPVEDNPISSFSMVNSGAGFSRIFPSKTINDGTGRNYGMELTLEKFFSDGFYFLTTGSLFDAKYKGADGVLRNTDFNGKYAFNALFAKEFKFTRSALSIGAKYTAVGGRWYGPVNEVKSEEAQEIIFDDATRNTLQFKPYRRLDAKFDYKINRRGITHTIAIDLINPLGIENILSLSYAPQPDGSFIKVENQLGFLPVFFYKLNF